MSIIIPANSAVAGGFGIPNGVRFNTQSSTEYMQRNMSSTGNLQAWTVSVWVKRAVISDGQHMLFASYNDSNNSTECFFEGNDSLNFRDNESGSFVFQKKTSQRFRDPSAWYHFVMSSSAGTQRIYVNGVEVTAWDTNTNGSGTSTWNGPYSHSIGANVNGGSDKAGLYMAEFASIDGQTLTAASFGEFNEDNGIWQPKDVTGLTFGTNGFYLPFSNSGALGEDFSGNNLDFATNNMDATNQTTDTCTNNFATMNPLFAGDANITYSEGNLKTTATNESQKNAVSTIAVSSGKWYCEMVSRNGTNYPGFGIMDSQSVLQTSVLYLGSSSDSYCMFQDGNYYTNGSASNTGTTWGVGSIMGVSIDLDSGTKTIKFYKDGSEEHSATIATPANAYVFAVSHNTDGTIAEINFGSPPYAISSGNADANGFGNFEYAPPSGYFSLCTKNLAEYG